MHTSLAEDRNRPFLDISDLCYFDLGLGHMAYSHASLIDLYLHTKISSNQKNFL